MAAVAIAIRMTQAVGILFAFSPQLSQSSHLSVRRHVEVGRKGNLRHHLTPPHPRSRAASLLQVTGKARSRSQVRSRLMSARSAHKQTVRTISHKSQLQARAHEAQRSSEMAGRTKRVGLSFSEQRKSNRDNLKIWLSSRFCSRQCNLDLKAWASIDNQCKSECVASLQRLYDTSDSVQVQPRSENLIQFPQSSSSAMSLHDANDRTPYNAMMFAGGVSLNGSTTFVARLCTHRCRVGEPFFDSTLILGKLEQDDNAQQDGDGWHWKHAAEHWVPHHDGHMHKGDYVGPEDPRMDVLLGSRFLTLGMNVPREEAGCGKSKIGVHRMFFVPVDMPERFDTCELKVPGIDKCSVQKNWASLVPRGSEDIFYVYSIKPMQVMRFQPTACKVNWLELPSVKSPQDLPNGRIAKFDPRYAVHGGTRYVFGGKVADGDLFWSVGHTPSPNYMPVLIGLLIKTGTSSPENPHIELVGVSCPIKISEKFKEPSSPKDETWSDFMLITTSIVDFDPEADVSTVTFQVHDRENYRSQLLGAGAWLKTAYKESRSGIVFSCDGLH